MKLVLRPHNPKSKKQQTNKQLHFTHWSILKSQSKATNTKSPTKSTVHTDMMTRQNTVNTPVQQKPVNHNSQILKYSQHSSSKNAEDRGLTRQDKKTKI